MVNFLYWLRGYLKGNDQADEDRIIENELDEVIEQYEKYNSNRWYCGIRRQRNNTQRN